MTPKKLNSIRILVVGHRDYKYIFEDAAGIPATSVSNEFISLTAKAELGKVGDKGKNKYPVLWLQKTIRRNWGPRMVQSIERF